MAGSNGKYCTRSNFDCIYHSKCCECINAHRKSGNSVECLEPKAPAEIPDNSENRG